MKVKQPKMLMLTVPRHYVTIMNSNSKTLILKDSSVRSIWAYITASPCYTTNTNKHDEDEEIEDVNAESAPTLRYHNEHDVTDETEDADADNATCHDLTSPP